MLRSIIKDSGLKYNYIAKSLGITPFGLSKKIDGIYEFKASEVKKICDILNISDGEVMNDIFFVPRVELKSTHS
jgi:hypothetical protein